MKQTIKNMEKRAIVLGVKTQQIGQRACAVLHQEKGEGTVDKGLMIAVSVALAAALLAGLMTILKSTILPTLTTKITDMFSAS